MGARLRTNFDHTRAGAGLACSSCGMELIGC